MEFTTLFVTWVLWMAVAGSSTCTCSSLGVEYEQVALRYYSVRFTTTRATKETYMMFIKDLRNALVYARDDINIIQNLPVLPDPTTLPDDNQRFLLVKLSNLAERTITIALDVGNVYVVAYQTEQRSFFLKDAAPSSRLFANTQRQNLSFDGSYGQLQGAAGASRENIALGIQELEQAISSLYISPQGNQRSIASALIVCIQMISEATRFRTIEQMVRESIKMDGSYERFVPNPLMLSLENNWGALSAAVQSATPEGNFNPNRPVVLQDEQGRRLEIRTVRETIPHLTIMLLVCIKRQSQMMPLKETPFSLPITSMVEAADDRCTNALEPTVHIVGLNGLCVDLNNGQYTDGTPAILNQCTANRGSQLWTFKRSGIIQSGGRCLTTAGSTSGSSVIINNCSTAAAAATKWEAWSNGTIKHTYSRLILTVNSANRLTVEPDANAARQSWFAGNETAPSLRFIVGINDLCMHTTGTTVWLTTCARSNELQMWLSYADGTMRPRQNPNSCLSYRESDRLIVILPCTGSSNERWVFNNDGTILNAYRGLVMEVPNSQPVSLITQVIVNSFTGNPNQIWYQLR